MDERRLQSIFVMVRYWRGGSKTYASAKIHLFTNEGEKLVRLVPVTDSPTASLEAEISDAVSDFIPIHVMNNGGGFVPRSEYCTRYGINYVRENVHVGRKIDL